MENFMQEFPAGDICSASHLMNSSNQPSVSYFYWFNVSKIDISFLLLIDTFLADSFTVLHGFGFISPEGLVQPKLSDPFQNRADRLKPVGTS